MHWIPFVSGMAIAKWNKELLAPMPATIALMIFVVLEIIHPDSVITSLTLGVALLYACGQIKTDNFVSRQALLIGQNTMGVYLLHTFFVWAKGYSVIDASGFHDTLILAILMIISFLVSIACVYITKTLQMFPVIGYLLFGNKIKK